MSYCKTVNREGYEYFITIEKNCKKGDYIALMLNDFLEMVKVEEVLDELTAICSDNYFYEGVEVIDITEYLNKRKAELQKRKLIAQMKEQMEIGAFRDKIKKNANTTPEMAKLYKQFCELENIETGTEKELNDF